jgi:hypothetical protein
MRPEEAFEPEQHVWQGKSGRRYRYSVHAFGSTFGRAPANFVVTREIRPGIDFPLYFGQTNDISVPLEDCLETQCAHLRRATHIHVHFNRASDEARRAEQLDLIAQWSPPCNRAS